MDVYEDRYRLRADLDEALAALRGLHAEQNGPPLLKPRCKEAWEAANAEAARVLKKHGA